MKWVRNLLKIKETKEAKDNLIQDQRMQPQIEIKHNLDNRMEDKEPTKIKNLKEVLILTISFNSNSLAILSKTSDRIKSSKEKYLIS